MRHVIIVVCGLALSTSAVNYQFPDGFKFGSSTAAFQIEGAWNVSDKTPSIWDVFLHDNKFNVTGDVACDSYHKWERDVQVASELGLHFYRFSISWTRLLPNGFSNQISEDGRKYYDNLINGLLERGIEPVITLYHWDLPQSLQDLGGWASSDIVHWFGEYARTVYSLYSDRVKTWITMNEPYSFCGVAYSTGNLAPGIKNPGQSDYLCAKNALMAHATAWRIYDEEFRPQYKGKVGLSNQLVWCEPANEHDAEAADLCNQFITGLFSHAVFSKEGGWPPVVEKLVAQNSLNEGHPRSRLPPFTKEEIEFVKGTYDFFGLNYYTSRLVSYSSPSDHTLIKMDAIFGVLEANYITSVRPEWGKAAADWFYIYNEGIRKMLLWLKQNYGDIEVLITENGYASEGYNLNDKDRIGFYVETLNQVLLSIYEDGVNVVGYTAWSLIDNLEWIDGFRSKFGLYEVDFEDPDLNRTQRESGRFYADLIRSHSLNVSTKYIT